MTSIYTLETSVRAWSALHTLGIETVEELAITPDEVILRAPNCGRKTLHDLRDSYDVPGLYFDQVQRAVGCMYTRFYDQIRDIEEREDRRVRRLQQQVYDLERELELGVRAIYATGDKR